MSELPFITLRRYIRELTDEEIITFEAFDRESQEILHKKLKPAKDPLQLEHAYRNNATVLFKPESIRISHKYNYLYFYTKAGQIGVMLDDEILDTIVNIRSTNVYFEVQLNKKVPISNTHAIYLGELAGLYEADYDFDKAKELLKEYKPVDLLMYAIGFKPTPNAIACKLAMILPLFQFNNRAIHTVHLTSPRLGKSRTAQILRGLASAYVTPMPSPAKLIYDGARGRYGLAYLYSTLYIDEFDKLQSTRLKDTFKDTYQVLLTGMSDGYWTREVSSRAGDYYNLVGFCFMGNVENMDLSQYGGAFEQRDTRKMLTDLLEDIVNPYPFVERIAYIEFLNIDIQAYKMLNYNDNNEVMYLHPKVSRAIIKILQDVVLQQNIKKQAESELDHHFNCLSAVLSILQVNIEDADLEECIRGENTFYSVLTTDNTDTENEMEDVNEDTLNDFLNQQWV